MARKIRVGLIGAGGNTRSRHIPGFQKMPGVEIVCVANRTLASGREVASQFGIPVVYEHWMEVVEDEKVDAVCIGTWPYLHAAATIAALESGKHVLCEARMAMNAAEARDMLAASQQSGQVAQVVPSPFGLMGEPTILSMLTAGRLGEMRELYLRNLSGAGLDAAAPLSWRQRTDLSGLNVMALGIYYETAQRWFGMAESVVAQSRTFAPRRTDPATGRLADADVPDSVAVLARWPGGAQGVFHLSAHAVHGGGPRLEAYGSAGAITYDFATDTLSFASAGDKAMKPVAIPKSKRGAWRVEQDFIDSIRDGRPVTHTNFADGLKYMQFTEAVARSAAEGRRVALSEV
ncbi:MAG: Myo-inositol 2-dehydrogenase [Phycisphaerae bacterium]|nr:Myo-inositol 2-dehydrogenase [Phycisphaerae bacterium]